MDDAVLMPSEQLDFSNLFSVASDAHLLYLVDRYMICKPGGCAVRCGTYVGAADALQQQPGDLGLPVKLTLGHP